MMGPWAQTINRRVRRSAVWAWMAVLAVLCVLPARAQAAIDAETPGRAVAPAAFQNVVLSNDGRQAYGAATGKNAVWRMDVAEPSNAPTTQTIDQPRGLALSADGAVLGVVSASARTLSLLDAATLAPLRDVATGRGPADVAALPDGGFAVVNAYSNTVTVVDPDGEAQEVSLEGLGQVPHRVASFSGYVAVAMRSPAGVHVLRPADGAVAASIPLPGPATSLAFTGSGALIIAAGEQLIAADPAGGHADTLMERGALTAVPVGEGVAVLTPQALGYFDGELTLAGAMAIASAETPRILASGGCTVALSDAGGQAWRFMDLAGIVESTDGAPGTFAAANRALCGHGADAGGACVQCAEAVEALEGSPVSPPAARAPGAIRRRPTPYDAFGPSPRTLGDILEDETLFGPREPVFTEPDWSEPFESIHADRLSGNVDAGTLEASGDVLFHLGGADFSGDYLYYDNVTGRLDARGNVRVGQGPGEILAERLAYEANGEGAEDAPEPDERLRGRAEADDIAIHEPGRSITAGKLEMDFGEYTGEAEDVRGYTGIFYFGASRVRILGPASGEGEDVWITTCDHDPPHYRLRVSRAVLEEDRFEGIQAGLEVLGVGTPIIWPRWTQRFGDAADMNFDFDSGRSGSLGYYANFGQRAAVGEDARLGYRLMPTEREGVGVGVEGTYAVGETSPEGVREGEGEFRSLYTTKDRGYYDVYHRQDFEDMGRLKVRAEQWSDQEFYKDFFFDEFRDRTEPRTFANFTHTRPGAIATATLRKTTHDFIAETQRLPEFTYHLLERPLIEQVYVTYDVLAGHEERRPYGESAWRLVNVARLTGDFPVHEAVKFTPFVEAEAAWYSSQFRRDGSASRFSVQAGGTLQTRLQRAFDGAMGFSGFQHIIMPSLTYSYRPKPTLRVDRAPRFDFYDNIYGRSRLEGKIDNVVLGRDGETGEVWQVGRLSLFFGEDLWNEFRRSSDYEVEVDVRPRPWWGAVGAYERHSISDEFNLDEPFFIERTALETYERVFDEPFDPELQFLFNAQYGDYRRLLSYIYYDERNIGGHIHARAGVMHTETLGRVFNREVLYGFGRDIGEHWSVSFEHRYDFDRNTLSRQEYELRRDLHCWEASVKLRERDAGWDVRVALNIVGFPGSRVQF